MSYILDALKKLEHEKSRKSLGDGKINISGALFEGERIKPPGKAGWKIAIAVIVAVLITFTATWKLLQSPKVLPSSTVQGVASPPLATTAIQPPPANIEPTAAPPIITPSVVQAVMTSPVKPPAPLVLEQTLTPDEDHAPVSAKREKIKKVTVQSAVMMVAAPADIKLSGIAYQDERRSRRAVVNGFLLKEGGVVAGATITDIFQDRVRFSRAGSRFELLLVSSGVPPAVQ